MDSNRREEVRVLSFPFRSPSCALEQSPPPAALPLSSFSLNAFPTRESRRTGLPSQRVCSLFLSSLTLCPSSDLLPLGLTRASSRATTSMYLSFLLAAPEYYVAYLWWAHLLSSDQHECRCQKPYVPSTANDPVQFSKKNSSGNTAEYITAAFPARV